MSPTDHVDESRDETIHSNVQERPKLIRSHARLRSLARAEIRYYD